MYVRLLGGVAATADPVIVEYACSIRDRVWAKAIPHQQYRWQ
ncbi:hypothetical protein OG203_37685 [Nocardia sp. NBC_01499]